MLRSDRFALRIIMQVSSIVIHLAEPYTKR